MGLLNPRLQFGGLAILALLSTAGASSIALAKTKGEASSDCVKVKIVQSFGTDQYKLKVPSSVEELKPGQIVTLKIKKAKSETSERFALVGRAFDPKTKQDVVALISPDTGQFRTLPQKDIRLESGENGPTLDVIAPTVVPREQEGPTCASHQLGNCVLLLNSVGIDVNMKVDVRNTKALEEALIPYLSSENIRDPADQRANRDRLLKRLGVEYKTIGGTTPGFKDDVLNHLRTGQPVLFYYTTTKMRTFKRPGVSAPEKITFAEPLGNGRDGHAVLALGVTKDSEGNEKVIIADSGPGTILLWDAASLKRLAKSDDNDAVLVSYKKVAPEAPGRVEFEKNWTDTDLEKLQNDWFEKKRNSGIVGQEAELSYLPRAGEKNTQVARGLVVAANHGQVTILDPKTGKTTPFWLEGYNRIPSFPEVRSARLRKPLNAEWQPADSPDKIDGLFRAKDRSAYGIVEIAAGAGRPGDFIFGKLHRQEPVPGYALYEIEQSDGTRHLIDPRYASFRVIRSMNVSEGSADMQSYFPNLNGHPRYEFINYGALLDEAAEKGILTPDQIPMPSYIDERNWTMRQRETFFRRLAHEKKIVNVSTDRKIFKNVRFEGKRGSFAIVDPKTDEILISGYSVLFKSVEVTGKSSEPVTFGGKTILEYLASLRKGR